MARDLLVDRKRMCRDEMRRVKMQSWVIRDREAYTYTLRKAMEAQVHC